MGRVNSSSYTLSGHEIMDCDYSGGGPGGGGGGGEWNTALPLTKDVQDKLMMEKLQVSDDGCGLEGRR